MHKVTQHSQYVEPELSEARVARLWSGVSRHLDGRRGAWGRRSVWQTRLALLVPAIAVAGLIALLAGREWSPSTPSPALQTASLATQGDALSLTLQDGSLLEVAPRSQVELEEVRQDQVVVQLSRGQVTCDVAKNPGRVFAVRAGGVEVRVIGTRFTVERLARPEQSRVEVRVERGEVEVRRQDGSSPARRLGPGDSWVIEERRGQTSATSEPEPTPAEQQPHATADEAEPAASASSAPAALPPATGVPAARSSADGPRELLLQATNARRSGDLTAAARAYQELIDRYGQDSRAGLAAFELGRLRMDHLGDAPGAARALQQSLRSAGAEGFREDALARLVRVYGRLGQTAACERTRDDYLRAHPQGIHAQQVQASCAR